MKKYIIILIIMFFPIIAYAHGTYTSDVLYTIPWGNDPDKLSSDFKTIGEIGHHEIFEPGPWAISNTGVLVIIEETQNGRYIVKFDTNGNLICRNELTFLSVTPWRIAILETGETALYGHSVPLNIMLFDSDLNFTHEISFPYAETYTFYEITPSTDNSFWLAFKVIEEIGGEEYHQYYKTEIFLDGTYSMPQLIWDDVSNTGLPARYISPAGEPFLCEADKYGYLYTGLHTVSAERTMIKSILNQAGTDYDVVYTNTSSSDSEWELFETKQNTGPRHFITWDGNFYTIHATDDGMVLTKYTYHPD